MLAVQKIVTVIVAVCFSKLFCVKDKERFVVLY